MMTPGRTRTRSLAVMLTAVVLCLPGNVHAGDPDTGAVEELRRQIRLLREEMAAQRRAHEAELERLQRELEALAEADDGKAEIRGEDAAEAKEAAGEVSEEDTWASIRQAVEDYGLGLELVLDTNYYQEDADETVADMMGRVPGFTGGMIDPHEEDHGLKEGFNLREVELGVSGELPDYFKARALFTFSEEEAGVEEVVFETTELPAGFTLMGGRFLSQFGYVNRLHPHDWDFVDRPLIYELTLGDHGLLEKGVQVRWRAPAPFGLRFGLEVLQGENEGMFHHIGGDDLPDTSGPRLGVGWMKSYVALAPKHHLQLGLFGAAGRAQELRDYDGNGVRDAALDGDSWFFGGDAVYTYDADKPHGQGDVRLIGEYFNRKKDLEVYSSTLMPDLTGNDQVEEQDGFYVQAVYGFLPRWRAGFRWDQVGLTNESRFPDGRRETYGGSYRLTGMVDWSPADSSYLRFQAARGKFDLENGDETYWQFFTQLVLTLGAGAGEEE